MLPSNKRLNLKKSFKWVRSGTKLESDLVKVFYRRGDQQSPLVGIALSSSELPDSTSRNRARRLVSKGFEDLYDLLEKDLNIVAMPCKKVLELSSSQVTSELKSLLKDLFKKL